MVMINHGNYLVWPNISLRNGKRDTIESLPLILTSKQKKKKRKGKEQGKLPRKGDKKLDVLERYLNVLQVKEKPS